VKLASSSNKPAGVQQRHYYEHRLPEQLFSRNVERGKYKKGAAQTNYACKDLSRQLAQAGETRGPRSQKRISQEEVNQECSLLNRRCEAGIVDANVRCRVNPHVPV
jgi:hypothetical protein